MFFSSVDAAYLCATLLPYGLVQYSIQCHIAVHYRSVLDLLSALFVQALKTCGAQLQHPHLGPEVRWGYPSANLAPPLLPAFLKMQPFWTFLTGMAQVGAALFLCPHGSVRF